MNPIKEIGDMYSFLGLNFEEREIKLVKLHNNYANNNNQDIPQENDLYYKTYRESDFDPNHWKEEIGRDELNEIESNCNEVIRKLDYPVSDIQ